MKNGNVTKFEPSQDLIDQAKAILTAANQTTLYARVDVIQRGNQLILMELELIEPNLYLDFDEKAADRLANATSSFLNHTSTL